MPKTSPDATTPTSDLLSNVIGTVDVKHEQEGGWFHHAPLDSVEVGPDQIDGYQQALVDAKGNGLKSVYVRSWHIPEFQAEVKILNQRAARIGSEKKRDEFKADGIADMNARMLVVDWDFTDRNGVKIPCEPETVKRILLEPQFRRHGEFITLALDKLHRDINEVVEADQGN